jgi:predicted kinase
VRMAPMSAENFLDAIAARDGISPALADALGDAVATYHAALPPVARDQAAALREVARGNARSALAAGLEAAAVARWEADCLAALAACADWLGRRAAGGFVRRAHGDLHLGNMAMWQGRPVAFDALEFDEDLATIDLGYDFAFLLMDLDARVGRAAANRVMNRYVARTGDWDFVGGLPVFLSLRAMVRAHVQARSGNAEAAATYLARAQAYLAAAAPRVVAIGGLPGTGKSTLARAVAPELGAAPGALILRSDEIRKRLCGVAPEVALPSPAYRKTVSRQVADALIAGVAGVAAHGHAVIADATFLELSQRAAVTRAADAASFTGLWLQAPMAVLEARVAARHGDASDADVAVLRRAAGADRGPGDWLGIAATDLDQALVTVRNALTRR